MYESGCAFSSWTNFMWYLLCQKVCLLKINHWHFPYDLWTFVNQGQVRYSFCVHSRMTIFQLLITQKGQLVWSWFLFHLKAIEYKIFLVSGNLCLFTYSIRFLSFEVTKGILNICTRAAVPKLFWAITQIEVAIRSYYP